MIQVILIYQLKGKGVQKVKHVQKGNDAGELQFMTVVKARMKIIVTKMRKNIPIVIVE